jgi:hypothetical protein
MAAMERYLKHEPGEPGDVDLIRSYLQQWIDSPVWDMNPAHDNDTRTKLSKLRGDVRLIETRADIHWWIVAALEVAIDPL